MTDNNDFHDDHDEFKFDDDDMHDFSDEHHAADESADDFAVQSKTKKSSRFAAKLPKGKLSLDAIIAKMPGKLQNKRVFLGLVFVVLVIIVYLFLSSGSSDNENISSSSVHNGSSQAKLGLSAKPASFSDASLTPAAKTKPVNVKAEEAKMHPQPKPMNIDKEFSVTKPQAQPTHKAGVSKQQLNTVITSLEKNLQQANAKQMQMLSSKLESQLSTLQVQNQRLHDSITALHKQLTRYKSQLNTANMRMHSVEKKVTDIVNGYVGAFNASGANHYHAVPQHKSIKAAPQVTTYTVQAVVPGRAWLAGSNGKIISVGVGQKVSGYGAVMAIDSNAGTVTMSNGSVLKPGA